MNKLRTAIVYTGAIALGLLIGMGLSLEAQENTPEAIIEAVETPVAPIVVEDGGVLIQESSDAPIVSNEIVVALIAVVGFVVGIVVGIRRGGTPDQSTAANIEALQQNRATMELLERQLASKDAITRMAFDTFAGFFKLISPLTPLLTDDAFSKFLEDLRTQGPPEAPGTPPSTSSGNPTGTIYTTPPGYPPPSINITTDTSGTSTPAQGSQSLPRR